MSASEHSYLLRRLEKLEAQVRNTNKGGSVKPVKSANKETIIRAYCRNEDGMEANRLVRIWTRQIDDGDSEDDELGSLPSCKYIDSSDDAYVYKSFKYGVTLHKVTKENDIASIQTTGIILVSFETNEDDKVLYGVTLFPTGDEGKIASFGDNVFPLPIGISLESENDEETYDAIKVDLSSDKIKSVITETTAVNTDTVKIRRISMDGTIIGKEITLNQLAE